MINNTRLQCKIRIQAKSLDLHHPREPPGMKSNNVGEAIRGGAGDSPVEEIIPPGERKCPCQGRGPSKTA